MVDHVIMTHRQTMHSLGIVYLALVTPFTKKSNRKRLQYESDGSD